jgi:molybdopterin/thiamine biosynthesis adenylyltransferase
METILASSLWLEEGNLDLTSYLLSHAREDLISWYVQLAAAQDYRLSISQVEEAILEHGLLPARYQRNRQTISTSKQLRLFRSTAAVVGCGGLGGYLIEEMARLGIGHIVMLDPDTFEEHNLNRQLYSSPHLLGSSKVDAAASRVREINPAVSITALQIEFSTENARELLNGADIVLDGLDSFATRRTLAAACREFQIPLVHGAIGGWYGHVATQLPGDDITPFLGGQRGEQQGVEQQIGNPSFTPALVASLQVAEACKVLLGEGTPLRRKLLCIDLREMTFEQISFDTTQD